MDELSNDQWVAALTEGDRRRFDETVSELLRYGRNLHDAREMTRSDLEQRHAPLALRTLLDCLSSEGPCLDAKFEISQLLEAKDRQGLVVRHESCFRDAREAVARIISGKGSYEDLAAFARLVRTHKADEVGFVLAQGGFTEDLPGWRLQETWHGEATGRPLSIWDLYRADLAAEARGEAETAVDPPSTSPMPTVDAAGATPDGVTSPNAGELAIRIPVNPAITEAPLLGPDFWRAVELARAERELWKHIPSRDKHLEARLHMAELGEVVIGLLTVLREALEHGDNALLFEKHLLQDCEGGGLMINRDLERVLSIPLRELVGTLSALAPGRTRPFSWALGDL